MQFYLQKMKHLQGTTQTLTRVIDTWQSHMTLTCGSQRLRLTVNVQIGLPGPILQEFIKLRNQICKLNYKRTKYVIEDKVSVAYMSSQLVLVPDRDLEVPMHHSRPIAIN